MKTIILFYSFSGKTKKLAEQKAREINADIEEVMEVKKPSMLGAFFSGVFKAVKRRKISIKPIQSDPAKYDQIIIMAPVWAGFPAPAFNNIVEQIPSGKKVEIIMVSESGKSRSKGTIELLTARGCEVTGYSDVKA